jgi:hypothetical protein
MIKPCRLARAKMPSGDGGRLAMQVGAGAVRLLERCS